jgi:hypothetical protein
MKIWMNGGIGVATVYMTGSLTPTNLQPFIHIFIAEGDAVYYRHLGGAFPEGVLLSRPHGHGCRFGIIRFFHFLASLIKEQGSPNEELLFR